MKKLIIAGGVIALIWYLWGRGSTGNSANTAATASPLTNNATTKLNDINLSGPSVAQKVPDLNTV